MAASELPPRSTITSLGEKVLCGTNASGTPSPLVSTAFAVRGSGRCTSLLKNCVWDPRSYLTPSSSTSVRSTKMIFAWMDTCGVRMSSPLTNSSTRLMRLDGAGGDPAGAGELRQGLDATDGTSAEALA